MLTTERKLVAAQTEDGAGVRIRRLFPSSTVDFIDPFVLLDEFFLGPAAGFPTHPHRGFEAVTYMLEGGFRHKDALGNDTTILQGGVQRFTAGRGLEHSEMPGTPGMNHGIQLWVNLPRSLKKIAPSYQQVEPENIPVSETHDAVIRTIAGGRSPIRLHTNITYLDIILRSHGAFDSRLGPALRGFIYLISGAIDIDGERLNPEEAYPLETGRNVEVYAPSRSRFLLIAGEPHNEPVHFHGSFVD